MGFLNSIVSSIAPIFIATSPITSYADQIYSIHRTRSSAGFSLDIPLIMLVSSILKVFYWFGAHFALSLLTQSILMISIHLLLLHIALRNRPSPPTHPTSSLPYSHSSNPLTHTTPPAAKRPYNFWQWHTPRPYFLTLAGLTMALLVTSLMLAPTPLYGPYTSLLGTVALAIEATLPLPQLYSNWQRRSTKGFRVSVIANWVVGDAFKLWYFFVSGTGEGGVPLAFRVCAVFQAVCDLGLAGQWGWWGDGEGKEAGAVELGEWEKR